MAEEILRNEEIPSAGLSNMGSALKNGIVSSLRGINEIESEVIGVARTAVTDTLGATNAIATEGFTVAKNILSGASVVGGELLTVAGQTATGAVQVISEVGKVAAQSLSGILLGVSGGAREAWSTLMRQPARTPEAAAETAAAEAATEETHKPQKHR